MNAQEQQHLQQFIRLLTTAAANASLYNLEHLQVLRLCKQALNELKVLFQNHDPVVLKIIDEQLIFANKPISHNLAVERMIETLRQQEVSFLQLEVGVYSEELLGLVGILTKRPDKHAEIKDSEHIKYGQIEVRFRDPEVQAGPQHLELSEIAEKEIDRFMDIYQTVQKKQRLDITGLSQIVNSFINTFSSHSDAFLAIAPLRSMDEYTYTHSTNICLLNLAQARLLGIKGPLLSDIGIAAMLHDVGKMFISPQILSKAGQLTAEEWQIMQQHPRLGAEYLLNTPGVPRLAVVTAYEHHMRYDGEGYPKTSRPWQQNLCSYMTAISDTYDAMRTHRAYEESLGFNQIINIMLDLAGTKLHPQLTYSFLQVLSRLEQGASGNH
jgi:HD-GYP domain-containing protein (c-di-GMP phosphodiesterase class II)